MSESGSNGLLRFVNVQKSYDQETLVVKDFNLDVTDGEFLTLLGPSGSGKTTVLMMVAGFEGVTSGDIFLDDKPITRTAPYQRNIGMVFQNYALFPHMSIAENLSYPLSIRKMKRNEIAERVDRYLKLIEMEDFAGRMPAQLSGGQRQRVALARALIFRPRLVLMDEPLGALDKKLREQMQLEITHLHKRLKFTVIYVTHDQTEALTMSDRIAVFEDGVVQQCAPPDELYEKPHNAFVADFIGENNFLTGTVSALENGTAKVKISTGEEIAVQAVDCESVGGNCKISIRPEKLFILPSTHAYDSKITVEFVERLYVGDFIRYFFRLPDQTNIVVKVLNDHAAPVFKEGEKAELIFLIKDSFAFDGADQT